MTKSQWLDGLQVTVAEFVIIRYIAATQPGGLNFNLKFTGTRV